MKSKLLTPAIIALLATIPAPGQADITYVYASYSAQFSLTVPNFLHGGEDFGASQLTWCITGWPTATCDKISFSLGTDPSYGTPTEIITYRLLTPSPYVVSAYFTPGTFTTLGARMANHTDSGEPTSLAIGGTPAGPSTPAVPEPASWAMMIGGLALVGTAMRQRKAALSFG